MKTCLIYPRLIALSSVCAGLLLFGGTSQSRATDGIWSTDSDGNWSDTSKWLGGVVADGADSTAYFTNDITVIRNVVLDSARTNGNLAFGDGNIGTPGGWNLNTSTLTLSRTVGTPVISVSPINIAGSTNDAWIASVLAGSQGFIKTGGGSLALAGNNTTFTNGGIIVQQGMLVCALANAFGPASIAKTNQLDGGVLRLLATPNNHSWLITANGGTLVNTNAAALNFNGQITGSGTLSIIASNMLTFGNNSGNVFSNFTGTVDLNGTTSSGNIRLDPGNGNANLGNAAATFDLGNSTAIIFTRYNLAGGTNTFFMGALKGGPGTVLRATGQGLAGGSTTIFQVGSLNVPTTFSGSLRNGTGAGGVQASAINKVGTSSLTLDNPTNSYTGATVISNGRLILAATGNITNSSNITPLGSGVFDVSAFGGLWTNGPGQIISGSGSVTGGVVISSGFLSPGAGTSVGRLTFTNDLMVTGTMTNLFKTGFGTNDSVLVGGNLVLDGVTTVQILPPAGASLIPNGTYSLFKWAGTLTGDLNNLALVYPAQVIGSSLTLQTNLVAKTISLIVSGNSAGAITWRGDGVNNLWDHSAPNWRTSGGGVAQFSELDAVTFDDSGSNNVPINLTDILTPSSLVVSNITRDYTFSGAGRITGVTALDKRGAGKLTVLQDNDFSGDVSINAGTIQIGDNGLNANSGSLGAGNVINNGTLTYARSDTVTLANPLLGSGTLVENGTNFLSSLTGSLILTADNNANNVLVSNGTLQLGDGTSGHGSVLGTITNNAILRYFYSTDAILKNGLSGNGAINYDHSSGNLTYTFPLSLSNPGFSGTMNIPDGIRVHSDTGNAGNQFGVGSQVIISTFGQAWVDSSASNYNVGFTIGGNGYPVDAPPVGALRLFNCTLTGPITMTANSRLGGTSSGATIQGQISGPFQLEILGVNPNPDNFVLTLAPVAGPNPYGSTLVTRGILQAGVTNAFTNAVVMAVESRMRLNGNDVTIASLSGGTPVPGTNCLVWNNSTANPATLTVGTDGSSASFDGTFGNGASQPLGVTKVGGGTWLLSAISSNTGPVNVNGGTMQLIGDGSFSNSTRIAVGSGAVLDVTGRFDPALYLNNGQTLAGSGTVNGVVNGLPGSTINPGNSIGTLSVIGSVNLAGTLLLELNRTNTPSNCDHLTASGAIIYGGTLSTTNIGPALQVNDTFQLFPGGVSGFTSFNFATRDANNKIYTWQNDVVALGSIKVLTVTNAVSLAPTSITFSAGGGSLDLQWPSDHTGWTLQTNAAALTSSSTWFEFPAGSGSRATNHVILPIGPGNTNVFFRLRAP